MTPRVGGPRRLDDEDGQVRNGKIQQVMVVIGWKVWVRSIAHTIHEWYIYLHLVVFNGEIW